LSKVRKQAKLLPMIKKLVPAIPAEFVPAIPAD